MLRAYGYAIDQKLDAPLSLGEVTFAADPRELRTLAAFLTRVADLMEQHGKRFGHEHYLNEEEDEDLDRPEFVVARAG